VASGGVAGLLPWCMSRCKPRPCCTSTCDAVCGKYA
jgi:hypothetical protein